MFGIEQFVAVLNPPQVAILAVGASEDRVVVEDGEFVALPTMTMTLTCDHRAIDGAVGADFLRTLKQLVESPSRSPCDRLVRASADFDAGARSTASCSASRRRTSTGRSAGRG